jgi:predicted Zn-dependent protease
MSVMSSIEPEHEALFKLAMDLYRQEKVSDARAIFDRLTVLYPEHKGFMGMRAWMLYRLGENESAIEQFRRLVALSPTSEKASLGLFHSLWASNRPIEALDEMKRFLSISESDEYEVLRKEFRSHINEDAGKGE